MLIMGDEKKLRVGDSFFVHGRNPIKVNLLNISEENNSLGFELVELTGYSEKYGALEIPMERGSERSLWGINLELIEMIPSEQSFVLRASDNH